MKRQILAASLAMVFLTMNLFSCSHQQGLSNASRSPQSDDYSSSSSSSGDDWYSHFGACLVSPDNKQYANKWTTYNQLILKKVRINIGHYNEMPVSKEVREFLSNLASISPILVSWNAIKNYSWPKKLAAYKNFVELTSSAAWVYELRDPNFVPNNQDPLFQSNYQDPTFQKNFDIILDRMRDLSVQPALTYFHQNHLIFVDAVGLASALKLAEFFQLTVPAGQEDDQDAKLKASNAADNLNYSPYMKDIPRPPQPTGATDNFTTYYSDLVHASITSFLENHLTNEDALDSLVSPDATTPYDDYVVTSHGKDEGVNLTKNVYGTDHPVGMHELIAIDGVARTLWGEARSCNDGGGNGFAAVALVMANRTIAVQNSLNEKDSVKEQNKAIEKADVDYLMHSDATSSLKGFVPETSLGQHDFGIKGSLELAASQVVSRHAQFSCWTGYTPTYRKLSSIAPLPAGMPDFDYIVEKPKQADDETELVNVLCPQINSNARKSDGSFGWNMSFPRSYDDSWKTAVDTATLIVLDPNLYKELYHFTPAPKSAPLFYTNDGQPMPGDPQLPVSGMTFKDPDTRKVEIFSGGTHCNSLKVFSARSRTVYGVSP